MLTELPSLLGLFQGSDVVDPGDTLAADKADVTAPVRDLGIGYEDMDRFALLRLIDHFLVQHLAALAQGLDDPRPVVEVVPELPCVNAVHLLLVIAEQLTRTCVVEEQPPLLVDHVQTRWAVL